MVIKYFFKNEKNEKKRFYSAPQFFIAQKSNFIAQPLFYY